MEEELEEKIEVKEGVKQTPLPFFPLLVLFLVRLSDLLALTSLFPYLSQMTVDLQKLDEVKDAKLVGYYSGFIAASYFIAQAFSAPFFGNLSDKLGRKPVMLLGTLGTSLSCALFAFSPWYWWALTSRFLFGALNGNLGVAKTYLREMCDETNQSRAFSMVFNSSFSAAIIIGPLSKKNSYSLLLTVGGFLSRPHEKLPIIFDNAFFRMFPYCLPNLFLSLLSLCGFCLALFFMKETRWMDSEKEKEKLDEIIVSDETDKGSSQNVELKNIEEVQKEKVEIPIVEEEEEVKQELKHVDSKEQLISEVGSNESKPEEITSKPTEKKNLMRELCTSIISSPLLRIKPALNMLMYAIIGLQQIVFDEVLPIWIWTPTRNYGLGLEPFKIGIIQGIVGFFLIFFQLFVLPLVIERLSIVRTLQLSIIMSMPVFISIPEVTRLAELKLEWLIWVLLIFILIWKQVWMSLLFTTINLLVGDSVPKENLGVLFGLSQSSVAIARTVGPSIAAPLFAMSISAAIPYPFGVHFTFYLSGIMLLMLLPLSFIDQKTL